MALGAYSFLRMFSSKNSLVLSGVTEKNSSSRMTHTPC